jgi:hypothetical protein
MFKHALNVYTWIFFFPNSLEFTGGGDTHGKAGEAKMIPFTFVKVFFSPDLPTSKFSLQIIMICQVGSPPTVK